MTPSLPHENLEDFLENSRSGHLSLSTRGEILWANGKILEWLDISAEVLIGKRITAILGVGSRMFYETHLSPLLKLKGYFEEVAAELLLADGSKMQVLINGYTKKDESGKTGSTWLNVYRATERKVYEDNLRHSVTDAERSLQAERDMALLREQFIAVLGHDLRNPLGAIKSGASLLARSPLSDRDSSIAGTIAKSSLRMEEMIANVMDFARMRLGGGIFLELAEVSLEPIVLHLVTELTISYPLRSISTHIQAEKPVICDANRLSQMLSNLLANALTHGSAEEPVSLELRTDGDALDICVINGGRAIPTEQIGTLFEPFTREANTPSRQGLGLGLYIAAQIAQAHGGVLTVSSDSKQTCFRFRMQGSAVESFR